MSKRLQYEKLNPYVFVTKLAGFEHTKYIQGIATHQPESDTDVPMVQGKNIRNGFFVQEHEWFISKDVSDALPRSVLDKPCILIPYVGSNLGEVGIFPNDYRCHLASNIAKVELISEKYILEYLKYYLQSDIGQGYLFQSKQGSAQPNITMESIRNTLIIERSQPEQQKICDVLSAVDQKFLLNQNICAELESMAKTLYDYWFTQFDFPNEEGKPYRSSGGAMEWNEQLKREIPSGWNCSVIANHIGNSKSGDWGKESATGNYLKEVICIRGADFPSINENKTLSAPTRYILEKNANKVLSSGDIIVEISGGSPTQSTGRICYINENTIRRFDKDIIISNFCRAFSTKKKAEQYWLYLLWKTLYDAGVLFGFEGKTTGIKNLLFDDFCAQYKIVCPEEDILEKFHKIVSPIFEKMQQYNIENDELTKLRDWLLPMLMNGQATVE